MSNPEQLFTELLPVLDELFTIEVYTNKNEKYSIQKVKKISIIKLPCTRINIPIEKFLEYIKPAKITCIDYIIKGVYHFNKYKLT